MPDLDRRQILKLEAAAMAAAAGGIATPAAAANLVTERAATELKWDKAPCRFCGTGCSVMVAAKDNRVVATHGDIKSEVNRGLNCVKGYFLSKIMYGHDRLTQPDLGRLGLREARRERVRRSARAARTLRPALRGPRPCDRVDGHEQGEAREGPAPEAGRDVRLAAHDAACRRAET